MADRSRIQIRTGEDPEVYEDIGSGTAGVPMPVSIETGDIEIGAVEIKDGLTDRRLEVTTDNAILATDKETPPTDDSKNNASTALSYDANGDLQYVDETIDGTTYRTTLSYTSRVLSGVSEAVEL